VFVDEERSYAERSGKANRDMGWIRVLAYREAGIPWLSERDGRMRDRRNGPRPEGAEPPSADRGLASPGEAESQLKADGDRGSREESNPGTGWGDQSWDPVNRTSFLAEHRATDHVVLRYEYASGLRALGIDIRRNRDRLRERERGDLGFAQPPRR
jgi:hypothetical protein